MHYLKLKDLFTTLNLFLSFYSVILVFEGKFPEASILVFVNVMFLDLLDGWVARLTRTFNEFGKYFDSVTDFIGSSVIVCFFIYVAYKPVHPYLAVGLAFVPLFVGVIREITTRLEKIRCSTYFIGFPRNSAAIAIIAYLNSSLHTQFHWTATGVALILAASGLQLTTIPFICNDKSELKLPLRIKIYLILAVVLQIILTAIGLFWDGILIWMVCYMISPFLVVEKEVWADIKRQR